MFSNNPYAMGTMSPGAMGVMQGLGMGGNGAINGMQQPQVAQILAQQGQQAHKTAFPDVGQIAQSMRGIQNGMAQTRQQGADIGNIAGQGGFQGPMANGANLNDAMAQRGATMQSSPYFASMMNRLGLL